MTDSSSNVGVVIPAGGRGERAGPGTAKQFRSIAGVPMLLRAVRPFARHPRVREIVVALPGGDAAAPPAWLAELVGPRLRVVPGGAARQDSVRQGLEALDAACTIVLVHDAARPFVSTEEIDAVIAAADTGVGAVAAVPVADTVKRVGSGNRIVETVVRDGLWRALTPQGFPRAMLEQAHRQAATHAGPSATDDAALVEASGAPVIVVAGSTANVKLTTADDFALAEALVTE